MRKQVRRKAPSRSLDFDIIAPFYDLGIWFISLFMGGEKRLRQAFINEAMPLEGKRTLEIFAGTATLSLLARRYGAYAVATDISAPMLKVAGAKSRSKGLSIGLVRSDSASLPFRDATFDRALVCMGLHEVEPLQTGAALREAARILESGGRLVIEDYHKATGLAGALQRFFFLFTEGSEARDWLECDIQGMLRREGFKGFRRKFLHKGLLQIITAEKA